MNNNSRMDILCPHFDVCSGCTWNVQVDRIPLYEEARSYFAGKGIALDYHTGAPCGWRCRAKLAVRGRLGSPIIGLFEKGSHHAINIPHCRVHHPAINQAVEFVRLWCIEQGVVPYDEVTGLGLLRYIHCAVERATGKVQLALALNIKKQEALPAQALRSLWEKGSQLWHSLWINRNIRRDNIIFSEEWEFLDGEELFWETLCGCRICFHPGSFAQANPAMFGRMVEEIHEKIRPQSSVLEYYAGTGSIGLAIASRSRRVRCVEIAPQAQTCFEAAVKTLPKELQEKLSFSCKPVSDALHFLDDSVDTVIVDPPRKGLDPALLNRLCREGGQKALFYASCGFESFRRDCEQLLGGGWALSSASAYLFFPGTNHIETLALFLREKFIDQ